VRVGTAVGVLAHRTPKTLSPDSRSLWYHNTIHRHVRLVYSPSCSSTLQLHSGSD